MELPLESNQSNWIFYLHVPRIDKNRIVKRLVITQLFATAFKITTFAVACFAVTRTIMTFALELFAIFTTLTKFTALEITLSKFPTATQVSQREALVILFVGAS